MAFQKHQDIFLHHIFFIALWETESEISPHSKQILNPGKEYFEWNCRVRNECNLDNKCLTPNIAYEAKVSNETNDECKMYLGASETTFKERFRNHIRDFKHKKYSHGTTLIVEWSIVKRVSSKTSENYYKLRLTEKFYIVLHHIYLYIYIYIYIYTSTSINR